MIVRILRTGPDSQVERNDRVAVEAPLEYLLHHPALGLEPVSFGTTMRTPGDDDSLAAQRGVHHRFAGGAHFAPHDLAGFVLAFLMGIL